eukprot:superscaffoldBa00004496_g18979
MTVSCSPDCDVTARHSFFHLSLHIGADQSEMAAIFAAALQTGGVKSPQMLMSCVFLLLSLQPAESSAAPEAKAWSQTGPRLQLSHSADSGLIKIEYEVLEDF